MDVPNVIDTHTHLHTFTHTLPHTPTHSLFLSNAHAFTPPPPLPCTKTTTAWFQLGAHVHWDVPRSYTCTVSSTGTGGAMDCGVWGVGDHVLSNAQTGWCMLGCVRCTLHPHTHLPLILPPPHTHPAVALPLSSCWPLVGPPILLRPACWSLGVFRTGVWCCHTERHVVRETWEHYTHCKWEEYNKNKWDEFINKKWE